MRFAAILILLICIPLLSAHVDSFNHSYLLKKGLTSEHSDVLYKAFGEFRGFLSDMSFLNADIYFHGGVYHLEEGETPHLIVEQAHATADMREEDHNGHMHDDDHEDAGYRHSKNTMNILLKISSGIDITRHIHLSGKRKKEILPWIYYAIRLNPKNVQAYSIGGFWLAVKMKKHKEGIELLEEGIENNPRAWQLYLTMGHIYISRLKDYEKAYDHLTKAKRFMGSGNADRFDRRSVLTFHAEACIHLKKYREAIDSWERILKDFPGSSQLRGRIARVRSLM